MLAKFALHYWRPDFTPGQARQLYSDYLEDLQPFSVKCIKEAMQSYRTDANKFFPTTGQLIETMLSPHDPSVPDREETRRKELRHARATGEVELKQIAEKIRLVGIATKRIAP